MKSVCPKYHPMKVVGDARGLRIKYQNFSGFNQIVAPIEKYILTREPLINYMMLLAYRLVRDQGVALKAGWAPVEKP